MILHEGSTPPQASDAVIRQADPPIDDYAHLDAVEAVTRLVQAHGAIRIARLVRMVAHVNGESVAPERPEHLCLACGGALEIARMCERCGRDNS